VPSTGGGGREKPEYKGEIQNKSIAKNGGGNFMQLRQGVKIQGRTIFEREKGFSKVGSLSATKRDKRTD